MLKFIILFDRIIPLIIDASQMWFPTSLTITESLAWLIMDHAVIAIYTTTLYK